MEFSSITQVLGGEKVIRKKIRSRMDLMELSREGVTKDALMHLARHMHFSMREMAEFVAISVRTIQRYTGDTAFGRRESEHILRIAEVAVKGAEVFGDEDRFRAWMNDPNRSLANRPPRSLLGSGFGTEMVLDELVRIEHGVFA